MTVHFHNPNLTGPHWTRDQIRSGRMAPLLPLIHRRQLRLLEREAGNYAVADYPGLIVNDSYWRWPERGLAGNAIDFCVKLLGLSLNDAMREITPP